MNRGPRLGCVLVCASLPLVLAACGYDESGEDTSVIGRVLLAGVPVGGANLRAIWAGFIVDTGVTAADGTFTLNDFEERWEPFLVQAFYIDPVTLNEYLGTTPFFLTEDHGSTDVGDIVLVQVFPATEGGPMAAQGDLDGDPVDDLAIAFPEALVILLASGESKVVATAAEEALAFRAVAIEDVDGDGLMDLKATLLSGDRAVVYRGDGRGRFSLP